MCHWHHLPHKAHHSQHLNLPLHHIHYHFQIPRFHLYIVSFSHFPFLDHWHLLHNHHLLIHLHHLLNLIALSLHALHSLHEQFLFHDAIVHRFHLGCILPLGLNLLHFHHQLLRPQPSPPKYLLTHRLGWLSPLVTHLYLIIRDQHLFIHQSHLQQVSLNLHELTLPLLIDYYHRWPALKILLQQEKNRC